FSSFLLLLPPPPTSTLFPYTTLFRSLHQPDIFRVGLFGPDFHEASPHGNNPERALIEPLGRLKLAVVPRTFDELDHQHLEPLAGDRKSTRLNSSHQIISYAVFCLKKK